MTSTTRPNPTAAQTQKINWREWPTRPVIQEDLVEEPIKGHGENPEFEDEARIAWGLSQCKSSRGPCAKINILYGHEADLEWKFDVNDGELTDIFKHNARHKSRQRCVRVCFIDTLQSKDGWLPGNFDIRASTIRILLDAGFSVPVLKNIYSASGYWAKMGNQRFLHCGDDGKLKSFEMAYQYRCGWNSGVSFLQLVRTQSSWTYFCINYPQTAFTSFRTSVKKDPMTAYRDFILDILAAEDGLEQWQADIGQRRTLLVSHELSYEDGNIDFSTATRQLHRLAREWHTLNQDILDLQAQLGFLRESYIIYMKSLQGQDEKWDVNKRVNMCDTFDVLLSQTDICTRWTMVYRDRTNVRINLLFHLANQREARTNTQIASSTAKVAELTQRDSASMITIAAVTMVFLPGTFICAILSTSFFDHKSDGIEVSPLWWVLPAATIPLTAIVFGVWLAWRYLRLRRQEALMPAKLPSKLA